MAEIQHFFHILNKKSAILGKRFCISNTFIRLRQLCPTQMAYWAKHYVIILTRAVHWITYWGPHIEWPTLWSSKTKFSQS